MTITAFIYLKMAFRGIPKCPYIKINLLIHNMLFTIYPIFGSNIIDLYINKFNRIENALVRKQSRYSMSLLF